jgi:hypothetical protein
MNLFARRELNLDTCHVFRQGHEKWQLFPFSFLQHASGTTTENFRFCAQYVYELFQYSDIELYLNLLPLFYKEIFAYRYSKLVPLHPSH